MKILGICGSPRKNSNSEVLLNASLEPFTTVGWEVQKILLCEKRIEACTGCESCVESGECKKGDDMEEVYNALDHCNAIIIAAPSYWRNVPSQLKALFDRSYAAKAKKPLCGKLGGAIAVGRGTGGGQAIVLNIIYNFYLSSGALCIPGELNGVSAQADKAGEISAQPRRLGQARILGENMLKYYTKY